MLRSSRVIKKRRGRKKFLFFLIIGLIFACCSMVLILYFLYGRNEKLFVSPLPLNRFPIAELLGEQDTGQVERALEKKGISFETVTISSDSAFSIRLKTGEEVLMNKTRSLDEQISSLQVILPRLTMEGKRFTRLDLRFDKPVIVFK